jgi:quercetin dioxygenase-like cupin family protein
VKVHNLQNSERVQQGSGAFQSALISAKDGANNIIAFMWELDPGVTRPTHSHANEHGGLVLSGEGVISNGKEKIQIAKDDVFFLSSQEPHEITNTGKTVFRYVFFNPVSH